MADKDSQDPNKIIRGVQEALAGNIVRMKTYDVPASPSNPEHPFGYTIPEMDTEAFFNLRDWLRRACEAAGATVNGAGIGMGQADLDLLIDGFRYNVSIRPIK